MFLILVKAERRGTEEERRGKESERARKKEAGRTERSRKRET